jgi:tetratricopeptide (TPR) repeat protein
MTPRMQALQAMLDQDPTNTFARYGLAMECANSGNYSEAIAQYRKLLEHNPDYAAAYYHGGRALEKMGDLDGARSMWEQGIAVTTRTGDMHTRSELQAALDLL